MAIAGLGPRCRSGAVDAFADLVGRRRSVASSFCISRRIYFRCGALADARRDSSDPGPHARCGARRQPKRRCCSELPRKSKAI